MKTIDMFFKLKQLKVPILQTQDVSALLNIPIAHASKILERLANAHQIVRIRKGVWTFPDIDPLALPELLTAPFPAYVSLQTALYYHGMISQIPSIIYSVSLARTKIFKTPLAEVSVHHLQPVFFAGYEQISGSLVKIATPEKALIDLLYLSSTKSRLFHTLPELEIPKTFKRVRAMAWIEKIPSVRLKTLVKKRFLALFS